MDTTEQARKLLESVVYKVPKSISGASVQVVREYKKTVVKARKALESRKATETTLLSLYYQLNQYQ